jgi:mRNA deadenylase 3'-5' endonuclease subunit Ccr4
VQGFVDETNRYANNSIVSKQLSPYSVWSAWKDVTVTEFWCFLATVINMGIIGLQNMKDYWNQEWSYHVPFSNYIFSRDRFMQIFWMLHLSPTPQTAGLLARTKTILCRLKAIDANKKSVTHPQFRWKLVEELSADRMTVQGSKKRGHLSSNDGAERLNGKQQFVYANENSNSKDCAVCSNSKIKGGHHETVYYCATCSRKP